MRTHTYICPFCNKHHARTSLLLYPNIRICYTHDVKFDVEAYQIKEDA